MTWLVNARERTHRNGSYMPLASDKRKGVKLIVIQLSLALLCMIKCPTTPALRRGDYDNSKISRPIFNVHPTPALVLASQVKELEAERVALVVLLHLL